MRAAYPAPVWDWFTRLPGQGDFPAGPGVVCGRGGRRRTGGEIEVWLALQDGQVAAARFRAWGCPYTLAVAAAGVAGLEGQPLAALRTYEAAGLVEALELPPERWGIRLWFEDAVRAAARAAEETRR
jgi:NifU-like protein involved in Fe-S cluster formation